MRNPKVSIILTTHEGRKDRCERAIKSILDQSYEDWELVIVDDASNDGTQDMVKSYLSEKVSYIRRETNWGNDTRPKNEGILASKGDYIGFLDSDNSYRPDHLALLVKELESDANIDVVYGDRFVTDENTGKSMGLGTHSDFDFELLFERNYIDTSDVLVRRYCLFAVGGFDERYKKYVDWNLWLRLYKYGFNFRRVPVVISNYFLGADSKSLRKEDERAFSTPAWDSIELEVELPYLGEKKEPKVALFTLTYDRASYTKESFSLLRSKSGYDFDHYIIDNGSTDNTKQVLEEYKASYPDSVHILYNEDNKGIAIASNQALQMIRDSGKEYSLVGKVDNDAYYKTQGWLMAVVEAWKRNHRLVLSCVVTGLKDALGGVPRVGYGQINGEMVGITQHLGGICCVASAPLWLSYTQKETDTLHNIQDVTFSSHARKAGYIMGYLENYYLSHGRSGTQGQHEEFPEYFERRKKEVSTPYEKAN